MIRDLSDNGKKRQEELDYAEEYKKTLKTCNAPDLIRVIDHVIVSPYAYNQYELDILLTEIKTRLELLNRLYHGQTA